MARAAKTWAGNWWTVGGGGTVWDSITYDPKTNLVLFGTGNAEPWNPAPMGRKGDNLYSDCVLALDADTGKLKWYYQFTPNDPHDWDSTEDMVLADQVIDGKPRKLYAGPGQQTGCQIEIREADL